MKAVCFNLLPLTSGKPFSETDAEVISYCGAIEITLDDHQSGLLRSGDGFLSTSVAGADSDCLPFALRYR